MGGKKRGRDDDVEDDVEDDSEDDMPGLDLVSEGGDSEDGKDEDGTLISSDDEQDAWLEDLDASEAAMSGVKIRTEFWDSVEKGVVGRLAFLELYLARIHSILLPKESARDAMDRLLGRPKPRDSSFKLSIKAVRKTAPPSSSTSSIPMKDSATFDSLVEATDALTAMGVPGILTESRETILLRLTKIFVEYRWTGKEEIHGPFAYSVLMHWQAQGCFKDNPIEIRHPKSNQPWRSPFFL